MVRSTQEQREQEVNDWHKKQVEKHGWYVHYVTSDDDESPTGTNIHTHGIRETFNHPDLQIVIPLPQEVVMSVLHVAVNRIKEGESFSEGMRRSNILAGDYDVTFIKAKENGREVIRIVLPDADGNLHPESITDNFAKQYHKSNV